MRDILVGAVLYDPKVSVIWDIIKEFFASRGCRMDCVFFSNYELQVDSLLGGHIDIAWNSPLAWLDAQRRAPCRAIAMRDTDRDRVTHWIVRTQGPIRRPEDLRGHTVATGAIDSPQATLLPLHLLRLHGLVPEQDVTVRRHDLMVGKHGDHVGGEREALRSLERGESAAAAMLDLNWQLWSADGTVDAIGFRVLATTGPFDHCNFTVLESFSREREAEWTKALFGMRYDEPTHREMMDMEGLKAWLPGRTSGYADLAAAVDESRFFERARA